MTEFVANVAAEPVAVLDEFVVVGDAVFLAVADVAKVVDVVE